MLFHPALPMRRLAVLAVSLCLPLCVLAQVPKGDTATRPVKNARAASGPSTGSADAAPGGYRIEPPPSWVIPSDETSTAPVEKAPMHYRVIDDQARVDGKTREIYTHFMRVVDDPSGLAVASQLEVDFDPSYQTFVVHRIDIVRDGKRSSRMDRRKVQLLHRETQLERQTYDGRITFSLAMDDVRPGDIIDVAYTIRGSNPVFEGRQVDVDWLMSTRGPVQLYRYRLLAPANRQIAIRAMPGDVETSSRDLGPLRETTLLRRSVALFRPEPGATSRALLNQELWLSEYASWQDVATWGRGLFDEAGRPMPAVDLKAAEIGSANSGKEARLLAALEFVQKDIRYFATEAGPNSHRPVDPEQVMRQRYGDCKDKVGLLLALLRRLDIPGEPLLVSTTLHFRVAELPPTPLAFDHVIARVALGDHVYWLDATRGHQTGSLEARQSAGFGKGLLLDAATTALTDLPSLLQMQRVHVDDRFVIETFGTPPILESRVTFRGDFAEAMRASLATAGPESTRARMTEVYARLYPKLKSMQEPVFESVPDDDAIVLVQRFSVPEFWKFPEQRLLVGQVAAWAIGDALRIPQSETRREALGLGTPGVYSQHISIRYPTDVFDKTKTESFDDGDAYFALHTRVDFGKNAVDITHEVTLKAEEMPAADWSSHQTHLRSAFPKLSANLFLPPIPVDKVPALTADIKTLMESVRTGPAKSRTKVQVESSVTALILNYEIDAGRLETPFLAEALTQRGIQRDQLALFDAAAPDFARAVELAPDSTQALNGAAVNATMRNRTDDVIRLTDAVLKQSPDDADALNSRMLSRYLAKDFAGAAAERDRLLKLDAGWRRGYPVVMGMLIDRRNGRPADAASVGAHERDLPSDWPRQLVDWSQGKIDAAALLAAARQGSAPAQRLCEAYFYLGEKADADGDKSGAAKYFKQATDQGVIEFVEDHLARMRLDARS